MKIERKWCMPNKTTFQMKPVKDLFQKYAVDSNWVDPFPYPYKEDALQYMKRIPSESVNGVLFDPPYSPRQLKECYDSMGQSLHDTKSSVWSNWKDECNRILHYNGTCISFGWNTNGLGKNKGFEIKEILLIAHGGMHNDTIVTVEKKMI